MGLREVPALSSVAMLEPATLSSRRWKLQAHRKETRQAVECEKYVQGRVGEAPRSSSQITFRSRLEWAVGLDASQFHGTGP